MNSALMRYALLALVAYFVCMATAHFLSIKVPLLFVYYDTPFHAYQDKIISFAVTAYVGLFWLAANDRKAVPVALGVLALTVLGLSYVNISPDLASIMDDSQSTIPYWAQTIMFGAFWVVLVGLYLRDGKRAA
jgi:di/tricarboxylate transporter